MMTICQNRVGGFGPSSPFTSPIPTPCFVDTILIPLPILIYILILLPLLFLSHRHRSIQTAQISTSKHTHRQHTRSCLRTTLSTLYYLLIIANILMTTLEIARLSLIHQSPALLPLSYVALLLAGGVHFFSSRRSKSASAISPPSTSSSPTPLSSSLVSSPRSDHALLANIVLWIGLAVINAVKAVGLQNDLDRGGVEREGRGKGTKYPLSDQVLDVSVMAGVYAVVGVLEVLLAWVVKVRAGRVIGEGASMEEGIVVGITEMKGGRRGWWKR